MYKYDIKQLKGKIINNFEILSEGEKIRESNKNRRTFMCKCKCGTIKQVRVLLLMNNKIKSCGNCLKDVVGEVRGHLEILEELERPKNGRKVEVRCNNCCNVREYTLNAFRYRTHCGCLTTRYKEIQPLELPKIKGIHNIVEEVEAFRNSKLGIRRRVKTECTKCGEEHILMYDSIHNERERCSKCPHIKKTEEEKRRDNPNYDLMTTIRNIKVRMSNMRYRCYNKNSKDYQNYGGRGITICDEWLDPYEGYERFVEWSLNNGYKKGLEIDRKDNDGNYTPENCRWVTRSENQRNKVRKKT